MKKLIAVSVISVAVALPLIKSSQAEEGVDTCLQKARTQAEMNQCAGVAYLEADAELNRVYKKIRQIYKGDEKFLENLKQSQLAWITLRDRDLQLKYPVYDINTGTGQRMCEIGFKTEKTLERVAFLKQWLVGIEEGDLCKGSLMFDHELKETLGNEYPGK